MLSVSRLEQKVFGEVGFQGGNFSDSERYCADRSSLSAMKFEVEWSTWNSSETVNMFHTTP